MGTTFPRIIQLLKEEFEVKKTSKYAFCKKTGINPTSVERYLCGISEPNQVSLQKLADYFGVPVAYLRGEVEAFEIQLSSEDISLIKSAMVLSGYTEVTDKSVSEFTSKLLEKALEDASQKESRLREEFVYNSKIIDHLHTTGEALGDSWLVENQKEVLKELALRQGKIVGELKEMGIDIFADPDWHGKKID